MDEYCNHCAQKYGMTNNFVGLVRSGKIANVYCKGCGITHVNHLGECQKCKYQANVSTLVQSKSFILMAMICCIFMAVIGIYLFN